MFLPQFCGSWCLSSPLLMRTWVLSSHEVAIQATDLVTQGSPTVGKGCWPGGEEQESITFVILISPESGSRKLEKGPCVTVTYTV